MNKNKNKIHAILSSRKIKKLWRKKVVTLSGFAKICNIFRVMII